MRIISKNFFLVLLAILVFSIITPVAAGTTLYVDDDGGSDYTTIQAAINNASEYDIIIVRDGTYNENVDVNVANLIIRSENGSDSTTVTASNANDHVFYVTANYVNISGFTVEGANSRTPMLLFAPSTVNPLIFT
ncbi:MAG: pectinesterase family protein [Halobacteriota archaeon]|nr:pectinesterase family protein [Halobacteriota archaeon]